MRHRWLALGTTISMVAACQGGAVASPTRGALAPTASPVTTSPETPPAVTGPPVTSSPTRSASPGPVPAGRVLFHRQTSDGIEHYFTIRTDGSDERALYEAEGCGCAHWMADGEHVMTLGDSGHGTWSFTTYRFDGTERDVVDNPIHTLNLAPGATTADGSHIAFNGWDETVPANTGLYLASPDLQDLHLVIALQEGWLAVEPFAISPDGSRIAFFVETGRDGDLNHAGDLYVVGSDGTGLRRLNPAGERVGFMEVPAISLSPDGRQAAFTTHDTVYVVDLAGGDARPITTEPGFAWSVSWSPTGEWLAYAKFHGETSVIQLLRPDGSEEREISARTETDEANAPSWSPDGRHLLVARDADATYNGPQDLWIMDLAGSYVAQVTHEPGQYGTVGWAPDPD